MSNKIVYNGSYGRFEPSDAALRYMVEEYDHALAERILDDNDPAYVGHLSRHDPALVESVEKLGKLANGCTSHLLIFETEARVYKIEEFDGLEDVIVHFHDDDEWVIIDA